MTDENKNLQEAIIRGVNIDLPAILAQHGVTGQYVVEHENGITAYFSQGPQVLKEIKVAAGQDPGAGPEWEELDHSQQRTVLNAVAGSVPWAMDREIVNEGVDEALAQDPKLSRMLEWDQTG